MLSYRTHGDGSRSVFLLHGFLGSARNLASLARRWIYLDPTVTLYVPDLTGHGRSPALRPRSGLEDLACDVLEFAASLGVPHPFDIVGHSMGGRVALKASLLSPGAISSIAMLDVGPSPIASGATADLDHLVFTMVDAPSSCQTRGEMRMHLISRGVTAALAAWLVQNLVTDHEGLVWRIDRPALADLYRRSRSENLWDALVLHGRRIRCVRGELSRFVSDDDVSRLRSHGAWVETLPAAGHFVHIDDLGGVLGALIGG